MQFLIVYIFVVIILIAFLNSYLAVVLLLSCNLRCFCILQQM